MLRFFFVIRDPEASSVGIDYSIDEDGKPSSHYFMGYEPGKNKECDLFVNSNISELVAEAEKGNLSATVDSILVAGHYLDQRWDMPPILAAYMSSALRNAAASFVTGSGRAEDRYRSVSKALGLCRPKGRDAEKREITDLLVYGYIGWRIKLFDETIYTAAKFAVKAFGGKHDKYEKIYEKLSDRFSNDQLPCPSVFLRLKFGHSRSIAFDDDKFLKVAVHHIKGNLGRKKKWTTMLE